ncbi:aminoglycoside phosphotransferase family protein [Dactylosporangium vinaceum]|uniref:Phosphotransferase family protein n=1 Tax=Dactylosporangium vinaceum TaxID=53362 RepID=A0ABV5MRL3_9ACTN|nr:aminoglycoside phosphotransferase family protein [Dactylosporangium vinaceum]UAC00410.1 aminoglycoside phosphotransferase family protein [Dactylosporangium vinaceum]
MTIGLDAVRAALLEACPGLRVDDIRPLEGGYTSRQWVADTDEGQLLAKHPVRSPDPEHMRRLIAATRHAADGAVPVVRFRAFQPHAVALGGPLLVQEFQAGTPADQAWDGLDDRERRAFAAELGTIVARIHTCYGPWFGDVLGRERYDDVRAFLHARVDNQVGKAGPTLPAGLIERAGRALHAAVDIVVPEDEHPALLHGDLWLPNILVRNGHIRCILDFEHGRWGDRFMDFAKLYEHIFDGYPDGLVPFLEAYDLQAGLPADWEDRVRFGNALHSLSTAVYFARWNPEYVPQYLGELETWLATPAD